MKLYCCEHCDYITERAYNMDRHTYSVHKLLQKCYSLAPEKQIQNPENISLNSLKNLPFPENISLKTETLGFETKQCNKCLKYFSRLDNLKTHIEKCKGAINKLECPACKTIFTTSNGIYKHKKSCTAYKKSLEQRLRPFLNENIDYITSEFANQCLSLSIYGLNKMIDAIYFHKEHPENHNIRLTSLSQSLCEIYTTEEEWSGQGLQYVICQMIANAKNIIMSKYIPSTPPTTNEIVSVNEIVNPSANMKRMIRDRVKNMLVDRRDRMNISI